MINKVFLIGRIGSPPEVKIIKDKNTIIRFNIATNESYKKDGKKIKVTEWHRIVVFGKLAKAIEDIIEKGRLIFVEGKLKTSQWEDKNNQKKYITEIIANKIRFLDKKSNNEEVTEEVDDDFPFDD